LPFTDNGNGHRNNLHCIFDFSAVWCDEENLGLLCAYNKHLLGFLFIKLVVSSAETSDVVVMLEEQVTLLHDVVTLHVHILDRD
jgi:hypothetical protein